MLKLKYKYYVINSDLKIMGGFNTEEKAVDYANNFRYKVYSGNSLKNKGIDVENFENWSFTFCDVNNK